MSSLLEPQIMSVQVSIPSTTDMLKTGWTHAAQARGTKLGWERGKHTQLTGITNNHNLKDDWWHLLPSNTPPGQRLEDVA